MIPASEWLVTISGLAVYAVALVATYRRWRWLGPLSLALAFALLLIVWGTLDWRKPHTNMVRLTPFEDWQCYTLPPILVLLALTGVGLLALHLGRFLAPTWRNQLGAVVVSFALAFYPLAILLLYWGVQVFACDTL